MLSISASATLMSYCVYTFTPNPSPAFAQGDDGDYSVSWVYGLFRVSISDPDSQRPEGSPEVVLLEDKPMLLNVVL